MPVKAEKKTIHFFDNFIEGVSEFWKSRNIPFLFEKQNGSVVITGYKDSLLPKSEIPSAIRGLPVK